METRRCGLEGGKIFDRNQEEGKRSTQGGTCVRSLRGRATARERAVEKYWAVASTSTGACGAWRRKWSAETGGMPAANDRHAALTRSRAATKGASLSLAHACHRLPPQCS